MRDYDYERWLAEERGGRGRVPRAWFAAMAVLGVWMMCSGGGGPLRVLDGDTADVLCGDDAARVRLLNVDTPERGQLGYYEAGDALEGLLDGEVYLGFEEPGRPTYDRYGRLLAYLYDDDGRNLNRRIIRDGWSPFYRKYGDGRFADEFEEAEEEAQENEAGLWEYE